MVDHGGRRSPGRRPNAFLFGVVCTSSTFCFAVGQRSVSGAVGTTALKRWISHRWSLVTAPTIANARFLRLNTVLCTSTRHCVGIGDYLPPHGRPLTLAEHWNGTALTRVPARPRGAWEGDLLVSVSRASVSSCIAAGEYELGGVGIGLPPSWSSGPERAGRSSRAPIRRAAARGRVVQKRDELRRRRALPEAPQPLRLRPDHDARGAMGRQEVVNQPSPGTNVSDLAAVSCWSTTRCFAVGTQTSASTTQTLTESGNCGTWTVVASP